MDLLLEARNQFTVGVDERLLGFDLGDDGLLRGEGWERNLEFVENALGKISNVRALTDRLDHLREVAGFEEVSKEEGQSPRIFDATTNRETGKSSRFAWCRDEQRTSYEVRIAVGADEKNVAAFDEVFGTKGRSQMDFIEVIEGRVEIGLKVTDANDLHGVSRRGFVEVQSVLEGTDFV